MTDLVKKLSALWLLVLVLSPFTAPFSTCDLPTLLRAAGERSDGVPGGAIASTTSLADGALAQLTRVPRSPGRLKLIALFDGGSPIAVQDLADRGPIRLGVAGAATTPHPRPAVLRI